MKALHLTPAVAALAFFAGTTALSLTMVTPARAASQHECEIWLCLPQGFGPSECNPAHKAMDHRIEHGHSPLPSFSSCSTHGDEGLSYTQGIATHVPKQTVCEDRPRNGVYWSAADRRNSTRRYDGGYCRITRTIPEHWEKNQPCRDGYLSSSNILCDQTRRTLTIFQRGQQLGNTYRW